MKRSPMPRPTKPLRRFTELRRTPPCVVGTSVGEAPAGGKVAPAPSRLRVGRAHRVPADVTAIVGERSDWECEIELDGFCWLRPIQKHHRVTQKMGGRHRVGADRSDRPSNIVMACTWCHKVITDEPKRAYANGWSLLERQEPTAEPLLYRGELVYLDDAGAVHGYEEAGA